MIDTYRLITQYVITVFSGSAILASAVILMMLSVPATNEWKKFRSLRFYMVMTFILLSVSDLASTFFLDGAEDPYLVPIVLLVVASFQALLFTSASLVFIRSECVNRAFVLPQLGSIAAVGALLFISYAFFTPALTRTLFYIAVAIYAVQLVLYQYSFHKEYKKSVNKIEAY